MDKTATEFREIKQSHYSLVEQVQHIQHEIHVGQLSDSDSKDMDQRNADIHKLKEENAFHNDDICKELGELRSKNKELEQLLSVVSKTKSENKQNTNLLATEKANIELVDMNGKLTGEVKQLLKN